MELFEQIRREIVWRRNDCRSVAEVGSAPADGAGGVAQCGAGREQATAKAAKEVGGWARVNCHKGPRLLAKLNRSQIWKCPFMPVQSPCRSRDLEEAVADANVLIERHRNAHGHSHHEIPAACIGQAI